MAEIKILSSYLPIGGFTPVDMQTADNNGAWVSMTNLEAVVAVLYAAIGTAGDDPVFTLEQATSAAGAGAKGLNFTEIYIKNAANVNTTAAFTKVTQSAASTYTNATSAEAQNLFAVEIPATSLDQANGYRFVRLTIPDTGANAKLGCGIYFGKLKVGSAPEEAQNVIA